MQSTRLVQVSMGTKKNERRLSNNTAEWNQRDRKTEDDRQAHRKMGATKRYKFHTT